MTDVEMPRLSDSMEEGKILRWLKAPGDPVAVGEILAEVETDKADMEVEAESAGVLSEIRVAEGESVPVGVVIATLDGAAAATGAKAPAAEPPATPEAPSGTDSLPDEAKSPPSAAAMGEPIAVAPAVRPAAPAAPEVSAPPSAATAPPISPLARKLAEEKRIDPSEAKGSGPHGRVERADVAALPRRGQGKAVPVQRTPSDGATIGTRPDALPEGDVHRVPMTGMRAAIARRMHESKRDAPHFYLERKADMENAIRFRAELAEAGRRVSWNAIVLKATADALAVQPAMNARFVGDAVELLRHVNLGMATAVADGLVVPVIRDADELDLAGLAARAAELAQKAADKNFGKEDLSGGTFTVSNLGMYGIDSFAAVINPPQAGILAVGGLCEEPVVRDGAVVVGHTLSLVLSCDHRAVDGAVGAQFLAEVVRRLEHPTLLLLPRMQAEESVEDS